MADSNEVLSVVIDDVVVTDFFHNKIVFCRDLVGNEMVAKFSSNRDKVMHEISGYKLAKLAGVKTPWLFGCVLDKDDSPGVLTSRLRGDNLYIDASDEEKFVLGSIIRTLHDNTPKTIETVQERSYYDYPVDVGNYLKNPLVSGVIPYELINYLMNSSISDLQSGERVVNHGDLHDAQVILVEETQHIIDFGEWFLGSGLEDLSIYLFHSLRTLRSEKSFQDFINGYTQNYKLSEQEKLSISFLLLFNAVRFVDIATINNMSVLPYAIKYLQRSVAYVEDEKLWKM